MTINLLLNLIILMTFTWNKIVVSWFLRLSSSLTLLIFQIYENRRPGGSLQCLQSFERENCLMVCRFCRKHHTGNILPNQHGITIYKAGQKNSRRHVQSKHIHAFIHSQNPVIDRAKTTDFLLNPFPSKWSVTVGKERKGEESRKAL